MILFLLGLGIFLLIISLKKDFDDGAGVGLLIIAMVGPFSFGSYMFHASDVGIINAQHYVIAVQQKRVDELTLALKEISSHGKQGNPLLLNADKPVSSLVGHIAAATTSLANSRASLAKAKVSIAKRKAGPFWFIVYFFGEPKALK